MKHIQAKPFVLNALKSCLLTCMTLAGFATLGGSGSEVKAASGKKIVLPTNPQIGTAQRFSKASGLQIVADTSWAGTNGYRPIKISLNSNGPLTAETLGTIQFQASSISHRKNRTMLVEQDFVIPRGATTNSFTLLLPQTHIWDSCSWKVWIDGKLDSELSLPGPISSGIIVDNKLSAVLLLSQETAQTSLPNFIQSTLRNNFDTLNVGLQDAPVNWIEYSGIDVIGIQQQDLEFFRESSPQKFMELLRWVRLGGNLWIFEAGQTYSALAEVDALLGQVQKGTDNPMDSISEKWRVIPLSGNLQTAENNLLDLLKPRRTIPTESQPLRKTADTPQSVNKPLPWFVVRNFGMGTVCAFKNLKASEMAAAKEVINQIQDGRNSSLLSERIAFESRHGNQPTSGNRQFHDWHIPDVGTAPVFEFQFLISLFVICIGPLNYWLLKRWNRLPLLLITVPMAALITTGLLFAYGFLADGMGTKVRVRSFTMLDQQAEEAVSWARHSYYSGIAPSEGLQFPKDVAIYPIKPPNFRSIHGFEREELEIKWDDKQQLSKGWLSSRTPTQYQSLAARHSKRKLVLDQKAETLSITNQLGSDIVTLAVKDQDGNWFWAEGIAADKQEELTPSTRDKVIGRLRNASLNNAPEFPMGYSEQSQSRRTRNVTVSLSENLMETWMTVLISPVEDIWAKGSYVACTRKSPEISLGIEDANETDSYHVIYGTW